AAEQAQVGAGERPALVREPVEREEAGEREDDADGAADAAEKTPALRLAVAPREVDGRGRGADLQARHRTSIGGAGARRDPLDGWVVLPRSSDAISSAG